MANAIPVTQQTNEPKAPAEERTLEPTSQQSSRKGKAAPAVPKAEDMADLEAEHKAALAAGKQTFFIGNALRVDH